MSLKILQNFPLNELTTFNIGGPAAFYTQVQSIAEILEALKFVADEGLKILVLGNGSNVLISDEGFDGLVIENKLKGIGYKIKGNDALLNIFSGENWDDLVAFACENNWAGIECLSGIPGSAGGAVVQNIGAYGQTLGDLISEVEVIEVLNNNRKIFSAKECEFAYRSSLFKKNPTKYIITKFQLKLKPNDKPTITYPHVKKHFEKRSNPNLAQLREFIIRLRASKGYVIMSGYECYKTAGSFFKNPVVSKVQFEHLKPFLGDATLNRFWETPNGIKIAAAYLMQESGFGKGYREGNVGISPKHSLSIVNFNQAKASEVLQFASKIKKAVKEKFGVELEEEVQLVGKFR